MALWSASAMALAQTSYVPWGTTLRKGGSELRATGRLWSSTSTFDSKGKEFEFVDDEGFSSLEGELAGSYGATDQMQFGLNAVYRKNSANVILAGDTTSSEASISGAQAVGGTITYAFKPVERMHYALEGFYRYTPYANTVWDGTEANKDLVLGDDGNDFGAGLLMGYVHAGGNALGFKMGYRRPGKELSPEINWALEGALVWSRATLLAGVEGVSSLNQDAYTKDPQNKPVVNTGGSQLYNSINRQYLAPYVGVSVALGKEWRLEAKYQQVMQARSYDSGDLMVLSLARRAQPKAAREVDKRFKEYDLEATVKKVSPKKQFVIIDKGLAADVQKGMKFDFYFSDYLGGNVLIARGVVIQVTADQAVVQLTTRYSAKHEIKEGTFARGIK